METITVTCPADRAQFAVVEPEDAIQAGSFTVTCPNCSTQFAVVYPEEVRQTDSPPESVVDDAPEIPDYYPNRYEELGGVLESWTAKETATPEPYTGSDQEVPVEQYLEADIREIGGKYWLNPELQSGGFDPDTFRIWYTPEHEGDPDDIAYVVRANLETGVKTKNIYRTEEGELYVKNRGVPRNSDKQWTFLTEDECAARAHQAKLPGRIEQDPSTDKVNRYRIFLGEHLQPLVKKDEDADEDFGGLNLQGELAEALVLELARVLVAFQTKRTQ